MSWQRDKSTIVLAVLSLGLAFLLVLRQTGRLGPLQDALVNMIVPAQYTVSRLFNNLGGKFEALVRMQELEDRNKELQETLDLIALRTVELEEAKIEPRDPARAVGLQAGESPVRDSFRRGHRRRP